VKGATQDREVKDAFIHLEGHDMIKNAYKRQINYFRTGGLAQNLIIYIYIYIYIYNLALQYTVELVYDVTKVTE